MRYDANVLSVTYADGCGQPELSFVSSGHQKTVAAKDVESVEFHEFLYDPAIHQHCPFCEQPGPSLVQPD